jgi:hypothetical protein
MPSRVGPKRNVTLVGSNGTPVTVNSNGRLDVVQHAHVNNLSVHFCVNSVGNVTRRDVLVDLSNTNSFFHVLTNYIHLENLDIQVDAVSNAAYTVNLGFLENVDDTDSDLFIIWSLEGSKAVGQTKQIFLPWYPNGPRCRSQSAVTTNLTRNNSAYQNDIALPSVFDPSTSDTFPGNGDLVLETIVTAQHIGICIDFAYHSH